MRVQCSEPNSVMGDSKLNSACCRAVESQVKLEARDTPRETEARWERHTERERGEGKKDEGWSGTT